VIVREARNILAVNLTGKSDPYVTLVFKETREKTKTVANTLNPNWNQEYNLYATHTHNRRVCTKLIRSSLTLCSYVQGVPSTLFVSIYNQNLATADKLIGKLELPLGGLIDGQPLERWFQLQPKKPGKRVSGEIKLYLLYRLNTS
jgi:Ca2+-dependent lipid-binding protein